MTTVTLHARLVGAGHPCFVIAEAGVNHNGDPALAHTLIDAAVDTGVDAVKFQTFSAERLVARQAPKAAYQRQHTPAGESQLEMLKRLELTPDVHRELMDHCRDKGVIFMSTPFDEESADLLEALGVCAYKISSGDVTNTPFLRHIATKNKPVILSTGMADLDEVQTAVDAIAAAGNHQLIVLHCVTNYPADPGDSNLRAMGTMAARLGVSVGWSDHTPGNAVALAAVAMGACVVEKHFTLDRSLPGPDHQASLLPGELRALVDGIRSVEAALGDGVKRPRASEMPNLPIARKSLHWRRALRSGASLAAGDFIALRPGVGMPPAAVSSLIGRVLARDVTGGRIVDDADFAPRP